MLSKEFERQVENLLQKEYPQMAGISIDTFLKHIQPLKEKIEQLTLPEVDLENGCLPFVIVVKSTLLATEKAMSLVTCNGKQGVTKMYPRKPQEFNSIATVNIPGGQAYLLIDIDRGKKTLNITPREAMKMIAQEHRTPLTIDEGTALIIHYPEFLIKNNCFSLLASRHSSDKRVPAIWINKEKRANLGWCWEGNPHTWLGSASCGNRIST